MTFDCRKRGSFSYDHGFPYIVFVHGFLYKLMFPKYPGGFGKVIKTSSGTRSPILRDDVSFKIKG